MKASVLVMVCACVVARGQDATAQALGQTVVLTQQSTQSVGNASPPAMKVHISGGQQAGQQAGQGGTAGSYDANAPTRNLAANGRAMQPVMSVEGGYVTPGTEVEIGCPDANAAIYFTTDGWTPTEASTRYTGPIRIANDTRVQAIAVELGELPSAIADVTYIVKPQQPLKAQTMAIENGVLLKGTRLRLVTGASVRSDTAHVGDTLLLRLDVNVTSGGTIVAARGATGKATLTRVERAGIEGKPGVLAFKVQSLEVKGITIPLSANLTLAAPDIAAQAAKISDPTVVQVSGALPKGDEAVIVPGMPVLATVEADTALR